MRTKITVSIIILLIYSGLNFAETKQYAPLTISEIGKFSKLSDTAFKEVLSKYGINFSVNDETLAILENLGISDEKMYFIQQEIAPIAFITEAVKTDYLHFSIINSNNSTEIRISQIEVELLPYTALSKLSTVARIETNGIILPNRQTELLNYDQVLSLKPQEIQSFSTKVSVKENFYAYTVYFTLKVKFFKANEHKLRYCYSDKIYRFSEGKLEAYRNDLYYLLANTKSIGGYWLELETLVKLGDYRVKEFLISALKSNEQGSTVLGDPFFFETLREKAVRTLGQIGNSQEVDLLIFTLADEDDEVVEAAVYALGQIGDSQAVDPLIKKLKDNSWIIRREAAIALGQIGDQKAIEPLKNSLHDDDFEVRILAAKALTQLNNSDGKQYLMKELKRIDEIDKNRGNYSAALLVKHVGATGSSFFVQPIIEILKNDDSLIQESAIYALGQIGDFRAIDPLINVLKDDRGYVNEAAIFTLSNFQDIRAIKPLLELLKDRPGNAEEIGKALSKVTEKDFNLEYKRIVKEFSK